jgi:proteasome lid subunit RPN8/RPN11
MDFLKDIKIFLTQEIFEQLTLCVKNASPYEACGLIFGDIKEIKIEEGFQYHYIGQMFECIESTKKSTVSFLIDNIEELNEIYRTASKKYNMRLISIFHSHPGGAYPSGVDTKNMKRLHTFKSFKNLIWTIMDAGNNKLNGFIYFKKDFFQILVDINKD